MITELSIAFEKKCDCCGRTELTKERFALPWLYAEFSSGLAEPPKDFCSFECCTKMLAPLVNTYGSAWVRLFWYEKAK